MTIETEHIPHPSDVTLGWCPGCLAEGWDRVKDTITVFDLKAQVEALWIKLRRREELLSQARQKIETLEAEVAALRQWKAERREKAIAFFKRLPITDDPTLGIRPAEEDEGQKVCHGFYIAPGTNEYEIDQRPCGLRPTHVGPCGPPGYLSRE